MNKLKLNFLNFSNSIQSNHKNLFLIFILILLTISCQVKNDNDFFFLYENGKQIINNFSFPREDWISIHDNINVVLQQWVVSVIDYFIYDNFGQIGLHLFVTLIFFITCLVIYFVCINKSNNYLLSYSLTIFSSLILLISAGTPRPQIYSVLFISLTILVFEYYYKTKNIKLLLFLIPVLSVLQSNFHSTFWTAFIIVVLFYSFKIFKEHINKRIDIVIYVSLSIFLALMNPYGVEALFQPFFTLGHSEYSNITELSSISGIYNLLFLIIPIIIFCLKNKDNKNYFYYADLILMIFTLIMTVFVVRSVVFFIIFWSYSLADISFKNNCTEIKLLKRTIIMRNILIIILSIMCASIFYSSDKNFNNNIREYDNLISIEKFLKEDNAYGSTFFSTDVTEGQYLFHKLNMHPYMDGRLELYIESMNKKEDIFKKYSEIMNGNNFEDFLNEYKFDYLILEYNHPLYNIARYLDNYEEIFDSSDGKENKKHSYKIYKIIK